MANSAYLASTCSCLMLIALSLTLVIASLPSDSEKIENFSSSLSFREYQGRFSSNRGNSRTPPPRGASSLTTHPPSDDGDNGRWPSSRRSDSPKTYPPVTRQSMTRQSTSGPMTQTQNFPSGTSRRRGGRGNDIFCAAQRGQMLAINSPLISGRLQVSDISVSGGSLVDYILIISSTSCGESNLSAESLSEVALSSLLQAFCNGISRFFSVQGIQDRSCRAASINNGSIVIHFQVIAIGRFDSINLTEFLNRIFANLVEGQLSGSLSTSSPSMPPPTTATTRVTTTSVSTSRSGQATSVTPRSPVPSTVTTVVPLTTTTAEPGTAVTTTKSVPGTTAAATQAVSTATAATTGSISTSGATVTTGMSLISTRSATMIPSPTTSTSSSKASEMPATTAIIATTLQTVASTVARTTVVATGSTSGMQSAIFPPPVTSGLCQDGSTPNLHSQCPSTGAGPLVSVAMDDYATWSRLARQYTNEVRRLNNLSTELVDGTQGMLDNAVAHSKELAALNANLTTKFLRHQVLTDIGNDIRCGIYASGENLAFHLPPASNPAWRCVDLWRTSTTGHFENLMSQFHKLVSVAVFVDSSDPRGVWCTQIFATPCFSGIGSITDTEPKCRSISNSNNPDLVGSRNTLCP